MRPVTRAQSAHYCRLISFPIMYQGILFSLNHHFCVELIGIARQYTYQRGFIATRYPRTQAAKLARVRHAG